MQQDKIQSKVFFYTTSPLTCPYLEGRVERRMVTELTGDHADQLHNALSKGGFRRSHFMAYTPVCPDCSACIPVRIVVKDFEQSKSRRRIFNKFNGITAQECLPSATQEQFQLFEAYQKQRHFDGDMASMDFFDYRSMIEETPVETSLVEFRNDEGKLVGCLLLDRLDDGLSAVYSFFHTSKKYQGFGNFMVLWSVENAREKSLAYVYLGYLIKNCRKMAYKERYTPLEGCVDGLWSRLEPESLHSNT